MQEWSGRAEQEARCRCCMGEQGEQQGWQWAAVLATCARSCARSGRTMCSLDLIRSLNMRTCSHQQHPTVAGTRKQLATTNPDGVWHDAAWTDISRQCEGCSRTDLPTLC